MTFLKFVGHTISFTYGFKATKGLKRDERRLVGYSADVHSTFSCQMDMTLMFLGYVFMHLISCLSPYTLIMDMSFNGLCQPSKRLSL